MMLPASVIVAIVGVVLTGVITGITVWKLWQPRTRIRDCGLEAGSSGAPIARENPSMFLTVCRVQ
jgi:hypothetical protein